MIGSIGSIFSPRRGRERETRSSSRDDAFQHRAHQPPFLFTPFSLSSFHHDSTLRCVDPHLVIMSPSSSSSTISSASTYDAYLAEDIAYHKASTPITEIALVHKHV